MYTKPYINQPSNANNMKTSHIDLNMDVSAQMNKVRRNNGISVAVVICVSACLVFRFDILKNKWRRTKIAFNWNKEEKEDEKKINRRYKKCVLYVWILFIHGDILHVFVVDTVAAAVACLARSFVHVCVFLSLELPKNKPLYIFCGLNCLKQKIKQRQQRQKQQYKTKNWSVKKVCFTREQLLL